MVVIKDMLCCSLVVLLGIGCVQADDSSSVIGGEYIEAIDAIESGINPIDIKTSNVSACKKASSANNVASCSCSKPASFDGMASADVTPKTLEYIHDEEAVAAESAKIIGAKKNAPEKFSNSGITPYLGFAFSVSKLNSKTGLKSDANGGVFLFSANHNSCAFDFPIFIGIKGYDPFYWAAEVGMGFLNQSDVSKMQKADRQYNGGDIFKDLKLSVRDLGFVSFKAGKSFDKCNVYGMFKFVLQDIEFGEGKHAVVGDRGVGSVKNLCVCPGVGFGYNVSNLCFRCEYVYKIGNNCSNKVRGQLLDYNNNYPEDRYGSAKDSGHVVSFGVEVSL